MSEYIDWKKKREEDTRKVIQDFGNLVNGGCNSESLIDEFCREHRTLQQSMFREILNLMCFMASDEYGTDGRNESSKAMAKKMIAGYAEISKQEELERLKMSGYSLDQAEAKAEEYKQQILKNSKQYIGLPHI